MSYKDGLVPVAHTDIKIGDEVYIDNYLDGQFPRADPKLSGPYTKVVGNGCGRCFETKSGKSFMHYAEEMLRKAKTE